MAQTDKFLEVGKVKTDAVDIVIKNGKIVTPYRMLDAGIAIANGKIVAIAKTPLLPRAEMVIDAKENFLLPGAIDTHAHLYDPEYVHREDFLNGTKAAAAGGVTTVIDMPLRTPALTELIKQKIHVAEKDAIVDFGFHSGMISEGNMSEIPSVARLGVRSFKVFTCAPFRVIDETLVKIMKIVFECDGVVYVHAEDDDIVSQETNRLRKQGRKDPIAYIESRPPRAELRAVNKVIKFAKHVGVRVHFAHLSTKRGIASLERAKTMGREITGETCPHYLIFMKKDIRRLGPYLKMTPPLRSKGDVVSLWRALKTGLVDTVASDHAPGTEDEKEVGWRDIWQASAGIPGVETLMPLMVSEGVNRDLISLQDLCRMLCERPAKIFRIYPRKGALLVGSDADIVIVDLKRKTTVSASKLHYKVGWTPYEGMRLKGYPILTIVRGEVVASSGEVVGRPGYGKLVSIS